MLSDGKNSLEFCPGELKIAHLHYRCIMLYNNKYDIYVVYITFSLTFSNEAGETTEKQTRKTSVCG